MRIPKTWNPQVYERKGKKLNLESELRKLEISLDDANNLGKYNSIKNELEAMTITSQKE